ncbi:hypothetical protein [Mesorhizobium xinjiangense]|uniref:hypothetical protein n=1 Tax=Mesorhizobium xinjiangense TaxID=2678685 RepID=UPI0012ECE998|nr:hypothetical protein [Mesorhizobium xinjiangense]
MNKKRIVVHIGANKTGSSAIQNFISINARRLRDAGIVVPGTNFELSGKIDGHHVWSFQLLFDNPSEGAKVLSGALHDIFALEPNASAVLLSAENLTANPVAPALFKELAQQYDIEIVIYIRRQDDYFTSSWQQWHSKTNSDFWAWAISAIGQFGNWRTYLERWETVVPRKNIKVRIFDRKKLVDGDVVADFYGLLDLSIPFSELSYPKKQINPSYADAVMNLVKGNSAIFRDAHDNDFYNFVQAMTGDRFFKNSKESSLTFSQRHAIVQKYAVSNRWVKDSYFPDTPGELFSPVVEGDYYHVSDSDVQRQQLEFLTELVYGMHKKGKK